jgi:hypothetical protein
MNKKTLANAWAEGHAATDEHGPGSCECENPYEGWFVLYGDGDKDGPMSRRGAEEMIDHIRKVWGRPPSGFEPMSVVRQATA